MLLNVLLASFILTSNPYIDNVPSYISDKQYCSDYTTSFQYEYFIKDTTRDLRLSLNVGIDGSLYFNDLNNFSYTTDYIAIDYEIYQMVSTSPYEILFNSGRLIDDTTFYYQNFYDFEISFNSLNNNNFDFNIGEITFNINWSGFGNNCRVLNFISEDLNFTESFNLNILHLMIDNLDYQTGYNNGYDVGYNTSYQLGYDYGYSSGYIDGTESDTVISTIFSGILQVALVPVNFFLSIFNFEILGINVASFVSALLTVAIIIIVVRSFMGGKSND